MKIIGDILDEVLLAPIETKDAAEDDELDIAEQVAELVKNTKAAQEATEKKVAKLVEDALAPFRKQTEDSAKQMTEIEKKLNRLRVAGAGGDAEKGDLDAERKALGEFVKTGNPDVFADVARKDMSVGSDPDGGYFVLPAMSTSMINRIFDQSPMRRLARVQPVSTGDAWQEPIDKDEADAEWIGETSDRPKTATPQVGMLTVPLNEIYANARVSQRILDDSFQNIGTWVEGKIGDKFGRREGTAFVNGDGIQKPRGFLTYATSTDGDFTRASNALQYVISGDASTITADALRDMFWSLRAPHRANASWLMSSAAAAIIDKLKDDDGRYLWRNSEAAGVPPTLLGRPVEFAEDMPGVEAGTFPIAFGDWQEGYLIIDRPGIKMLQDPYTAKPHVMFYGYRRVGGSVANTDAIKLMKIAAS